MDTTAPIETCVEMQVRTPDAALCENPGCRMSFYKRVKWQRYCGDECRTAHHKGKREPGKQGIRGALADWRPLKGGKVRVYIDVDAVEAAALVRLAKGQLVGLVE